MARKTRSRCSCGFDFTAEHNRHRRVCGDCGQKRVPKSKPKHLSALEVPYADYITLNGGEICGICERPPSGSRRLDRDHWHSGPSAGKPRGLLCHLCNRALGNRVDADWARAAAAYLERAA